MANTLFSPGPLPDWSPDKTPVIVTTSDLVTTNDPVAAIKEVNIQLVDSSEVGVLSSTDLITTLQLPVLSHSIYNYSLENPTLYSSIQSTFLGYVVKQREIVKTNNRVFKNSGALLPYRQSSVQLLDHIYKLYLYILKQTHKTKDSNVFDILGIDEDFTTALRNEFTSFGSLVNDSSSFNSEGSLLDSLGYEIALTKYKSQVFSSVPEETLRQIYQLYLAVDKSYKYVAQYQYSLNKPDNFDLQVITLKHIIDLYIKLVKDTNTIGIRNQVFIDNMVGIVNQLGRISNK